MSLIKYHAPATTRQIPIAFGVVLTLRVPAAAPGEKLPAGVYHDQGDGFIAHVSDKALVPKGFTLIPSKK